MFRVIVADDDKLIREDICSMVNWQKYGFSPPKQYDDGAGALKELQKAEYSLVITDISMPIMNGIELILKGRKASPGTVFVALSNYDDFKYVKEAMKLGAEDYLLKYQLEPKALRKLLKSLSLKITKQNIEKTKLKEAEDLKIYQMREMIDYFWKDIYFRRINREAIAERSEALHITLSGGIWIPVLMEAPTGLMEKAGDISEIFLKSAECLPEKTYLYHVCVHTDRIFMAIHFADTNFLMIKNQITEFMCDLLANLPFPVFICSGNICKNLYEFPAALQQITIELPKLVFYKGFGGYNFCPPPPHECACSTLFPEEAANHIINRLGSFDEKTLLNESELFFTDIKKINLSKEILYDGWEDLLKKLPDIETIWLRSNLAALDNCQTIKEFISQINEILLWINTRKQMAGNVTRVEIVRAVQYIYGHFNENISLDDLAEFSGMSRNYLSKIFKEQTGINYSDFLNSVRIEHAKKLLRKEGLRTNEAAEQVGFEDYRYFCRLFKKITGITCGEYRRQNH